MREWTDAMDYKENMEHIDSDVMDRVLSIAKEYDPDSYTIADARKAINGEPSIENFGALLSPVAGRLLEDMAVRAREETLKHFGNSVCMFTPIYTSNYCENNCVYCGFNIHNKIVRACLTPDEVDAEMAAIASTGLKEILILTGETRKISSVEYIGMCVKTATKYFSTIGIEVYPLNSDEYRYIHECGADYVTVFQETYDYNRYAELHLAGPKRIFSYRFNAQERALMGGMRGVAFGALLGLGDFRRDAFACGVHAYTLQKKYPHAEISFSLPRFRPFVNNEDKVNDVHEPQLLQVSLAYRLFMPFAGQTISTRERPGFRDHIVGLSATKISAGVSTGIGEHSGKEHGDSQFVIADPRDVDEVAAALRSNGLQPVMTDYVRL